MLPRYAAKAANGQPPYVSIVPAGVGSVAVDATIVVRVRPNGRGCVHKWHRLYSRNQEASVNLILEKFSMSTRMGAREARRRFSEVIGRVGYGGETVILERSGKPMAAVVPLDLYNRMVAERDARLAVVDRIRDRMPELPTGEVEQDVADAVSAVRAENAARRP